MSLILQYRNSASRLWNAEDVLQMQTDLLTDGVANMTGDGSDMKLLPNTPLEDMTVLVESGRCYLDVVVSGELRKERIYATARETVPIAANASGNARIDAVVVIDDPTIVPDAEADNVASYEVVQGTPAGSPTAPTDEDIQTELGAGVAWHRLGNVTVANGETQIETAHLEDTRVRTDLNRAVLTTIPTLADLASTAAGKGADLIGVDATGIAATDLTSALEELDAELDTKATAQFFNAGDGSDGELNVTSGTTQIDCGNANFVRKQYTSFNISAGATVELINVPSDGVILVLLVQGNVTIAGTLDLAGDGAAGGAGVTASKGTSGAENFLGANGSNPFNNFGQKRYGSTGSLASAGANGNVRAGGAGSGASTYTDGTDGQTVSSTAGGAKGVGLTQAMINTMEQVGIKISAGGGGGSGGARLAKSGTNGTVSGTSGDGGRGGGGLLIYCGGDYSMTGTITLAGQAASANSTSDITTSADPGRSVAVGGSSGGAAGCGVAFVRGTITDSGTKTVTGGAGKTGHGAAAGSNYSTGYGTGQTGAAGSFRTMKVS